MPPAAKLLPAAKPRACAEVAHFSRASFQTCRCAYTDGTSYAGNWRAGRWHGRGKHTTADGGSYEGGFEGGERHGQGVLLASPAATAAEGAAADGAVVMEYDGGWARGAMAGVGRLVLRSGETYEGHFEGGRYHGRGVLCAAGGRETEGDFDAGEASGDACTVLLPGGGRYEGAVRRGLREGEGECAFASGDVYAGAWLADQRHGLGRWRLVGGGSFEGSWRGDQMQGRGVFTMPSGAVVEGEWEGGVLRGAATLRGAVSGGELRAGRAVGLQPPSHLQHMGLQPPSHTYGRRRALRGRAVRGGRLPRRA